MPEKSALDIQKLLNNLRSEDNVSIVSLQKALDTVREELERAKASLSETENELESKRLDYKTVKEQSSSFKDELKPIIEKNYDNLLGLLGLDINLAEFSTTFNTTSEEYMELRKTEMAELNATKKELEASIKDLTFGVEAQTALLEEARKLQSELIEYTTLSDKGELNLTKKALMEFFSNFCNENGERLFNDDELSVATQLLMFPENFELVEEQGVTIKDVLREAGAEPHDETSIEDIIMHEEPSPISLDDLGIPGNMDIEYIGEEKETETEPIYQEPTPVIEPVIEPVDAVDDQDLFALIDDLKEADSEKKPGSYLEVQKENEEFFREAGYDLNKVPVLGWQLPKEQCQRYLDNIDYLRSVGIIGDTQKCAVSLFYVTREEIDETLEKAQRYGIGPMNVVRLSKLLSTNHFDLSFEDLIERVRDEYQTIVENTNPSKLLEVSKNIVVRKEETNRMLREFIPRAQLLDELDEDSLKDQVLLTGPAQFVMNKLLEYLGNNYQKTKYAYIIGDEYVSISRVRRNLTKLLALDPSESDEELLLIACTYDGTKNKDQIEKLRKAIDRTPDINVGGREL